VRRQSSERVTCSPPTRFDDRLYRKAPRVESAMMITTLMTAMKVVREMTLPRPT